MASKQPSTNTANAIDWAAVSHICTPRETEVLRLRIQRGHSWRRIAAELDCAPTTARDRYTRAMQRIAIARAMPRTFT